MNSKKNIKNDSNARGEEILAKNIIVEETKNGKVAQVDFILKSKNIGAFSYCKTYDLVKAVESGELIDYEKPLSIQEAIKKLKAIERLYQNEFMHKIDYERQRAKLILIIDKE